MKVGWRPACRWLGCGVAHGIMCQNTPRRNLRIIVVKGGSHVRAVTP